MAKTNERRIEKPKGAFARKPLWYKIFMIVALVTILCLMEIGRAHV